MKYLKTSKNKRSFSVNKHKRKIKRLSSLITPILFILVVIFSGYVLFFKLRYFDISNVRITGAKSYVNELDMLELVKSRSYGKNLVFYDTKKLKETLLRDFQGAKALEIKKEFPKTINIQVEERQPLAILYNKEESFLVDNQGYVLGLMAPDTSNFPRIFYESDIAVGYFLDEDTINMYFEVISATDEAKLSVKSVSLYDRYLKMVVEDDVEVLIGKDKDTKGSIEALKALLQQLKSESKNPAKVDLRYDKVIVSYR